MVSSGIEIVDTRRLPSRVVATLGGWAQAVRAALTRPGPERFEAVLLLKAAVATVLAWQVAVHLLDSPAPFYAPMAALLVVDRTMVRSLGASARRVAAVVRRHEHRLAGRLAGRRDVVVDGARHVRRPAHRPLAAAGRPRHPGADDGAALAHHGQRHRHRLHLPHDRRDGARRPRRGGGQRRRAGADAPRRAARRAARPHLAGAGRARGHRDRPARGVGRRRGPGAGTTTRPTWATGFPWRCRRWRPAARAPGGTGGTGCARPGSTGTATCAPSRRCAGPSGRWPASPAPSSTPRTTPTGTRRRPPTGCAPTPTSSTRWGRRSRTSACGPTTRAARCGSTSTGRSRRSTR